MSAAARPGRTQHLKAALAALGVLFCRTTFADERPAKLYAAQAAVIAPGDFIPQYGLLAGQSSIHVADFALDRYPVTNQEFRSFVASHPEWRRGTAPTLLADSNYLKHWSAPLPRFKSSAGRAPVTNVSWFAANDFCVSRGGRLPSVFEWEYVASADETKRDASRDPAFVQRLLNWYSRPSPPVTPPVGQNPPNAWGVYDMHGLVWEWTSDFNSVFVAGDNRREGDDLKNLFCAPGAISAADKANYAAFMRYAMRSSLLANYSTPNLGFRCAYSITKRDR